MKSISPLWSALFKPAVKKQKKLAFLKAIPIFSLLKKGELKEIENIIHYRFYKKDEVIIYEKDIGCCMYIISAGEVTVLRNFDSDRQIRLATLQKGDFFGEMALLLDSERGATVVSAQDSEILAVYREELFQLFEKNSALGVKVLTKLAEILAQRLLQMNEAFEKNDLSRQKS